MKLTECMQLATSLMADNGLLERTEAAKYGYWSFKFDNAVKRFGCAHFRNKIITLSLKLVELNSEEVVRDVILHEIAHVIAGRKHGHNYVWQEAAWSLGCSGNRSYNETVKAPAASYFAPCDCGNKHERIRMPRAKYTCAITHQRLTFMRVTS